MTTPADPATIALMVGVYLEGARGIPLFQSQLARWLAELDPRHDYRLFGYFFRDFEAKKALIYLPDKPNFRLDIHRWPSAVVDPLVLKYDLPVLWPFLKAAGVGLVHSTNLYTPPGPGLRKVTTVCDLIPERFPEWAPGFDSALCRKWLARADRLVAISEHTRRDVIELYGIPEDRVEAVLLGVDTEVFRPAEPGDPAVAAARARYGLPARYLLTVGPVEPRRDMGTLVRALAELRRGGAGDLSLAITGSGPREELRALARELGVDGAVLMPGYVPTADLVRLQQGAEAFVYASLYEGFGLSALEALACGTPVVSSDAASLPEVLGGAASLVRPRDPEGLARAVLELRREPGLRARRVEAGLKRARELTWRKTAESYLRIYERVLGERPMV